MHAAKPALLIPCIFLSLICLCQNKTDTVFSYYDWQWKPTTNHPSYLAAVWPENGNWHRQDYYYPAMKLQMDGIYADKELKLRQGVFTWYNYNGMMNDSCLYVAGKKEGIQIQWNRDGYQTSVQKWKQGLPIDTAYWFSVPDGNVTAVRITDERGNGLYRSFAADGKTVRINGRYADGKQSGKWTYRDEHGVLGVEAIFLNDSVKTITCFDETGAIVTGKNDCEIERPAKYRGGIEGWRKYLVSNLQYPPAAEKKQIEGVIRVQFYIDKEGNVSDVEALDPSDADLAKEAVRIIKNSGKWEPAIQYNRKVIYRHIQSVTFRLE